MFLFTFCVFVWRFFLFLLFFLCFDLVNLLCFFCVFTFFLCFDLADLLCFFCVLTHFFLLSYIFTLSYLSFRVNLCLFAFFAFLFTDFLLLLCFCHFVYIFVKFVLFFVFLEQNVVIYNISFY